MADAQTLAQARQAGTEPRVVARQSSAQRFSAFVPYAIVLLPALWVLRFVAAPILTTALASFDDLNGLDRATGFAGLANYRALFADPLFQTSLRGTIVYAGLCVVLSIVIAYLLAIVLSRHASRSRILLVALFSPTVMPMIAAANVWLYFLAPQIGILAHVVGLVGLSPTTNLLGEPPTAIAALAVLFVWKYAPYFALFLMAGLQAIPRHIREALVTEDPRGWQSFRRVILPMLAPMVAFVTVLALLYSVETVDSVYVMTQGGPASATSFLMFFLYQLGFNYFSWGPAAALSGILMASLSTLSGFALIVLERRAFHWQ